MKKATQSKTLWYIVLTALGVAITALVADENFKELIGGYTIFLYLADKMISAYLRSITTLPLGSEKTEVVRDTRTTHEKNLDILEPTQADDDFLKGIPDGS